MMDFLRKYQKPIFIITLGGLLAGVFVGLGSYSFHDATGSSAIATVNGKPIPLKRFEYILNQTLAAMREKKEDVGEDTIQQQKQRIIQELIQEEVFYQEARKYKIKVTDAELSARLQSVPAFQKNGRFDQMAYRQVVFNVLRTNLKDYEESFRRNIANSKLRNFIASGVRVTEAEIRAHYAYANKGSMKDFEKKRAEFEKDLHNKRLLEVSSEWFKKLNQNVKIKVFNEKI